MEALTLRITLLCWARASRQCVNLITGEAMQCVITHEQKVALVTMLLTEMINTMQALCNLTDWLWRTLKRNDLNMGLKFIQGKCQVTP